MSDFYYDENGNLTNKKKKKSDNSTHYYYDKNGNLVSGKQYNQEDDYDIAPVKNNYGDKDRKWFESGAFSDGYQFGDVTKTILGTANDIVQDATTGIMGIGENTIDAGAYLVGGAAKLFGADEFSDNVKDFIKKDIIDEKSAGYRAANNTTLGWINHIINGEWEKLNPFNGDNFNADGTTIEKNSLLGDKSDSLVQSGGQLAGTALLQSAGVPWFVTTGITSFGGAAEQAFNEDATYGEAGLSSLISAGADILTEKMFGGSGLGEKGLINLQPLTKGISSKVVKALADFGINMAAEGAEEVVASVSQRLGTALYKEENLKDILLNEDAIDEYIESFIGGAALGGVMNAGKTVKSVKQGTDYNTGLTASEEKVFDKAYNDALSEAENSGKNLSKKDKAKIHDDIMESLKKGYLSTDMIESELGGDDYKSYKDIADSEDALIKEKSELQKEYDILYDMKNGDKSDKQIDRQAELKKRINEIDSLLNNSNKSELKSKLTDGVKSLIDSESQKLKDRGSYLAESYNEIERRKQAFNADLTQYTGKQREAVERAINSGVLNNTNRSHDLVRILSQIEADKGIAFDYTNNAKLKDSRFAVEGKTVNGYVTKNGVTLNVQSSKAWQSVVGHEITHVLEGTDAYTELRNALYKYAESKGELESRKSNLTELYKGIDADIDAELTADLVGDYLFSDKDFINNLTNNRTLFQKIYDEIKYLCKVATGKELTDMEKVKREFDKAWKKVSAEGIDSKLKYSIAGENAKTANISALNDAKSRIANGEDSETVRQETGWFKGYDGKWRFEIDDSQAEFRPDGDVRLMQDESYRRLQELTEKWADDDLTEAESEEMDWLDEQFSDRVWEEKYRLDDYLDHPKLYEAYPMLRFTSLVFDDLPLGEKGFYNPKSNTIVLSRDLFGKQKNTLLHEIQHIIQKYEGFAKGSSPKYWRNLTLESEDNYKGAKRLFENKADGFVDVLYRFGFYDKYGEDFDILSDGGIQTAKNYLEEIEAPLGAIDMAEQLKEYETDRNNAFDKWQKLKNRSEGDLYGSTAGEIEARDVSNRLDYTSEQRKNTRPDIDRTDVVFADESSTSMEIVTLDNGKQYVRASESKVIKGTDTTQWSKQIADYINNEIRKWNDFKIQTVEGDILTITRDTAYKAGSRNQIKNPDGTYRPMSDAEYLTKLNAEVHINELSEISKKINKPNAPDTKKHRFANNGFSYRTAYFQDYDGKYYKITLSVGENGNVSTVYNVGKINKDTLPNGKIKTVLSGSKANSVSDDTTVPQKAQSVNTSISENVENDTKNSQFSLSDNNSVPLEQRVSGDNLLDAQDLIDTVKDVGAKVDGNGYITVYHRTNNQSKEKILSSGQMTAKEDGIFFSTKKDGQNAGYGSEIIEFKIPAEKLMLDDIFDDEAHLRLPLKRAGETIDVKPYLTNDTGNSQFSLSENGEQPSTVGTPLQDLYYEAPVREDIAPTQDIAENATTTDSNFEAPLPNDVPVTAEEANAVQDENAKSDNEQNDPIAQVLTETPEQGKKKSRIISKIRSNFIDKGSAVEDLALKTKNRALQDKYKTIGRSEAKAQYFMENGSDGVKSLKDIRQEVEQSGKVKEFFTYLYHKHNVDRMSLESKEAPNLARLTEKMKDYQLLDLKENQLRAIAMENVSKDNPKRAELVQTVRDYLASTEIKNKPVFGDSVTAEASWETANQLEKQYPQFKQYANDVYSYMNHLRDMMVENGIISKKTADLWAEMYPYYVPIGRVGKNGFAVNVPLDTNRTGVNAPIHGATGGNSDILPLFDTMAQRTIQTFKAIDKNNFGIELKNTLGSAFEASQAKLDDVIDTIDTQDGLLQDGKNGKNPTFTVFEDGKRVTFDITDDLYDAMKPTSEGLSYTNKVLNKASSLHKKVLTEYNLFFTARNAIKDAQDVLINSQHPAKTYANFPQAVKELVTGKGEYVNEYWENGGKQNTYFDRSTNTFAEEKSRFKKIVGFPLEGISKANDIVEAVPRLAEYIASRKKGATVEAAMLDAARVTTDFSAGGDVAKFLNRNGATFLNASVQGAAQQVRNIREAKANGLKGMVKLAGKYALAGLPALLLNSLIWGDDEEYEELSDYVKDNYYIVGKYGDGQFVRIPKGRTLSVIQELFEQIGKTASGEETDWGNVFTLAASNLAPNNPLDNNVIAPIVQAATNKTWYGEDLVPKRLQDVPASEQYDETIDSISKWLGENTGISPYKINYVLNQYTGFIGDMFIPALTPEAERGNDSFAGNLIAPLTDQFTVDKTIKNQNTSDFFSKADELKVNANSQSATDEDILKSKYMSAVNSEMSDLYKQKREIQNLPLRDSAKYAQVRSIQEKINELAKNALNTYNNVNIDNGYATVGDKHYRLENGVWTKISDKQLERQQEVTSKLGISPSEYWSKTEISYFPNIDGEYEYAYDNPEKYAVAKSVGGYEAYKSYKKDLYSIKSDKDTNGKSISGSRKAKVIDYINNLDADYETKIILFKSEYPSDNTYNAEIVEYLNNREDVSYDEMVDILTELGFTVTDDGVVKWN